MSFYEIFTIDNFQRAWKKTRKNYKWFGIDRISVKIFEENLDKNLDKLRQEILYDIYLPAPLSGFELKKDNGKKRYLAILCIRDYIVQHIVHDYLNSVFEPLFIYNSFAFRPEKSYITAVEKVIEIAQLGYHWIIRADIASFFDTINRALLYKIIYKYIPDLCLLKLIRKWVEAGVVRNGRLVREEKGIHQGIVISPLLSNIYLHPFDIMIVSRGFNLVRYCDDFVILSKTEKDATQALNTVKKLLNLFKLNLKESSILITSIKYGFNFLGKKVIL